MVQKDHIEARLLYNQVTTASVSFPLIGRRDLCSMEGFNFLRSWYSPSEHQSAVSEVDSRDLFSHAVPKPRDLAGQRGYQQFGSAVRPALSPVPLQMSRAVLMWPELPRKPISFPRSRRLTCDTFMLITGKLGSEHGWLIKIETPAWLQ